MSFTAEQTKWLLNGVQDRSQEHFGADNGMVNDHQQHVTQPPSLQHVKSTLFSVAYIASMNVLHDLQISPLLHASIYHI